jgi:rubrerythrin
MADRRGVNPMGLAFTSDDIFDIAIQIEKNGNEFYTRALAQLGEGDVKDCFARLAAQELEHADIFHELRAVCGEQERAARERRDCLLPQGLRPWPCL